MESLEDRTLFSVNVISTIKGLDTNDAGGFVEPPDTIAAAGPNVVIEEVNSNLAIYSKSDGHQLATLDLGTFFSSVDTAQSLFSDVNVTYDEQAGRFFVSTMDIDFGTNATGALASYFDFAVSNDSNPTNLTTSWSDIHQIETDEVSPRTGEQLFTDFPRLGWNADAYVVAFNMFGFNTEYQYNAQVLTIDKASVLDKNASTLTFYQVDRPLPNSTMVPAVMHGSSSGDPMWFVEEKGLEQDGSYADLRVVKMTNVLSSNPTFTDYYVPIDAYTITPFPQDTIGLVSNVLDTRILNVDWRNNEMAVAQNVGIESDMNVHARWYEINTAGAAPSMVQQGTLNPGAGVDTYMPSVALATDGTIGMTYIESALGSEDMSMYVTGRAPTDPLGTMQGGVLVKTGEINYLGTRIGDFSGITVDPTDGTSFWAANEYALSHDPNDLGFPNWGTWIGHFNVDTSPGAPHLAPKGSGASSSSKPGTTVIPPKDGTLGRSRGHLLLQHPPAAIHRGTGGTGSGGIPPLSVNTGVNFKGLDTNDAGGFIEPPDTIAAAGPNIIIEEVNSNIAIYRKSDGQQLATLDLGTFFSSVDTAQSLFSDVNVTYDEQAGRFFVSTMDIDFGTSLTGQLASYFDFAISNDSNPTNLTTSWTEMHQIETDEVSPRTGEQLFTDFPRLGWNADAYVVAFNMFGFDTEYQYNAQVLTINKASVLDKNASTLTFFQVDRPLPNATIVPAVMHGSAPGDPMWFVEEKGLEQDGSYADLRVVKMTNVLSSNPTFTDYYAPLAAYTITPFPQDTLGMVSFAIDTRILNVDWRNNEMAVAQDVGIDPDMNVHARWYEINTAGAAPSMVQQGTLNPGAGIDTYMPSVALATDGTIGMTYIQSAVATNTFAGEDMSMYVTGRAPTDPTGTMQDGALVKAGEQFYEGTRIGDFSGITLDPTDGTTFWAANEYAINDPTVTLGFPNWGTWIASFTVTPLGGSTTGSISGLVFNDLNGDGLNENEPGFNGVTIDLFDSGNNLVGTTVTATGSDGQAGEYSFINVTAGNFSVVEIVPGGWIATTATSAPAMVMSGQDTGGVDFGDFQLGALSGTQFEDVTGDGFSPDDPHLSSTKQIVTIDLFLNGGSTPVASTTTDSNGNYTFSNLGPGRYTVQEVVPSGWILTAQTAATTVAASGFASTGNNFDDFQLVSISGTVFNDLNGDGSQELGEPGLQSWVADLMQGQTIIKQLLTAADGTFNFTNIGPGTFSIREEVEPGWLQTSAPTTYTVTTNSGVNVIGDVFGNFQTVRISGTVFNDLNGDGIQEAGEPGLQGWTVDLARGQNPPAKRTTDSNGNFTFVGVGPGTFTVKEEVKAGWAQTSTPLTYSVTTSSGMDVTGNVFGNITPATHFTISTPTNTTAGVAFSFTVTALDAFNNTVPTYMGTVTFSSTDPKPILPANYKFTSGDAGVHTFSATLRTAGSQTITATDTVTSSITGTSSGITVSAAATTHLVVSRFPFKTTAGVAQSFRVTAQDRFGNTTPSFMDMVAFGSSDLQAVLPDIYMFTSTDMGVHNFTATLKTAGTQSLTAQDKTPNSTVASGTLTPITVVPAATSQFLVSGFPPYVTAGVSYPFTVTAADAYSNTTPTYRGTVTFGSSDNLAVLPVNYQFTSADAGVHHNFAATLNTTGTQSISATDTVNAGITGTENMIVVFVIQPTVDITPPPPLVPGQPVGVPGQPLTFTLNASESGLSADTIYSFSVQWGDGSPVQTLMGTGDSRTQVTHTFINIQSYTITVTATDPPTPGNPSGNTSAPVSISVSTTAVLMEKDPLDPNLTALYVGGTTGDDNIAITPVSGSGVKVGMNFVNYGSFFPTSHIEVYGLSGNDIIKTAPQIVNGALAYVTVPLLIFGGDGNDILNVSGSSARNVLVGGSGADRLIAGSGGDILIGGATDFDNNAIALASVLAEWSRTDADYLTRIAHLMGTMSGGLNHSTDGTTFYFLTPGTVHADNSQVVNDLYGGPGMDWYFVGMMDLFFNKTAGEMVTHV